MDGNASTPEPPTPPSALRALWALVCAALVAALLIAAPLLSAGHTVRSSRTLAGAEPSTWWAAHPHKNTVASRAADRAQLRRCARAAYRRAHAARCPNARAFARPGTQLAADGGPAASVGRWAAPFQVPTWAIHAVLLPTGKVLWLSKAPSEADGGVAHLYDPATGAITSVPPPDVRYPDGSVHPANLFCAGQAVLPDGRVLVAGGNLAYYQSDAPGKNWRGSRWLFTFNPWNETWTRQADMAKGRWYPTVITLPDGRALISGGWDENGNADSDDDLEVFRPSPQMDGANGTLTRVGTRLYSELYPHMFVIPDTTVAGAGSPKILVAGPFGHYPSTAGIIDTADWSTTPIPYMATTRELGSAVLIGSGAGGPDQVLLPGGSDAPLAYAPTRTSAVLDLNAPDAGFRPGPPLATARTNANTVLLPDGSVLAVGGGIGTTDPAGPGIQAGPIYSSELLSPGAGAFRTVDSQQDARTYHSTALLLPDGRVLSAGDDRATHTGSARTAEIYSPPYLYQGARPAIAFAPGAARYDVPIRVGTPDPGAIAKAVLMRPSAVTHVTDMDQRAVTLSLTAERGGLTLRTPRNGTVAPPGYYMLFLLDRTGVPSVARWIRLDPSAPDAPEIPGAGSPPAAAPPAAAPPADGSTTTSHEPRDDRSAPRVTLKAGAPTRLANGTLTAVIRVKASEPAGAKVRLALGRRVAIRTLRATPGGWAAATIRFGHAPRHSWLHLSIRATDAAGYECTAARDIRY